LEPGGTYPDLDWRRRQWLVLCGEETAGRKEEEGRLAGDMCSNSVQDRTVAWPSMVAKDMGRSEGSRHALKVLLRDKQVDWVRS
jgi:hypothetical protein